MPMRMRPGAVIAEECPLARHLPRIRRRPLLKHEPGPEDDEEGARVGPQAQVSCQIPLGDTSVHVAYSRTAVPAESSSPGAVAKLTCRYIS